MTLGFLVGSRNFCKLLWVSCEVFVLHGYDCIHCVAKPCTTAAYLWLLRDSHPSLRTLWSAVIKSTTCSVPGTTVPVRLLQGALVISVLMQSGSFGLSGSEYKYCASLIPLLLAALKVIHEHFHLPDCPWTLLAILADHATSFLVLLRSHHFYLNFRFLLVHATSFFVLPHSYSLLSVAGFSVLITVSCDEDVEEVGEHEVEELVDRPGTANGTYFAVSHSIFLPLLMRCGFWPVVQCWVYPWSSQSFPGERTAGVSSYHCQE